MLARTGAGRSDRQPTKIQNFPAAPLIVYITTTQTYTIPDGYSSIRLASVGAGGGSFTDGSATAYTAGGAGGGCASKYWRSTSLYGLSGNGPYLLTGKTVVCTIGAGSSGATGGNTTAVFNGETLQGNGGTASVNNVTSSGGSASGGTSNFSGGNGGGVSGGCSGGGGAGGYTAVGGTGGGSRGSGSSSSGNGGGGGGGGDQTTGNSPISSGAGGGGIGMPGGSTANLNQITPANTVTIFTGGVPSGITPSIGSPGITDMTGSPNNALGGIGGLGGGGAGGSVNGTGTTLTVAGGNGIVIIELW